MNILKTELENISTYDSTKKSFVNIFIRSKLSKTNIRPANWKLQNTVERH